LKLTYEEAVQIIIKSYGKGRKGGFDVCRRILSKLGDPHTNQRFIHVAGTNAKGSTCAFLQNILLEAGYTVGMFTSPHLIRFNERFNINGTDISDDDFSDMVSAACSAYKEIFGVGLYENDDAPTISYFELLTIIAFYYFKQHNVDFAIIEVGIGGRIDATNILESPLLSVITKISFDHMDVLGNTIEAIAGEKCGIIKPGSPIVLFHQSKADDCPVLSVAQGFCDNLGSPLYYPSGLEVDIHDENIDGITFSAKFNHEKHENMELDAIGSYQAYNAANAVYIVQALRKQGVAITDAQMRAGLKKTRWPGRMEILSRKPLLIVDGAHNAEGAAAVRKFIDTYLSGRKIILITGVLSDKDFMEIIAKMAAPCSHVILTSPKYSVKAHTPETLQAALPSQAKFNVITDCDEALEYALKIAEEIGDDAAIIVSGSLYLVGDIKNYVNLSRGKND